MSEKPILFSTEMVKKILAGEKTQTRRVVKCPKSFGDLVDVFNDDYLAEYGFIAVDTTLGHGFKIRCPFGKIGDTLWVREAFSTVPGYGGDPDAIVYRADNEVRCFDVDNKYIPEDAPYYDESLADGWNPSIHMPRFASRITLEIMNIRVERLQDISEADAKAEGVYCRVCGELSLFCSAPHEPQYLFASLWDSINAKRGFGWDKNNFVWVIDFKRV